jgi:hypothetical protein
MVYYTVQCLLNKMTDIEQLSALRTGSARRHPFFWIVTLVVNLLAMSSAKAIVLDWDKLDWVGGSLSMTFYATNTANASTSGSRGIFYADDEFSGSGSVTITITGSTGGFVATTPNDSTSAHGGTGERALLLHVDQDRDQDFVTIAITFNYASVSNTSFNIFDIDKYSASDNSYVDQIRSLYAQSNGGAAIAPVSVVGSVDNTVEGTGTARTITGVDQAVNTTGDANAFIDFGTNYLTSFTFVYGNSSKAAEHPSEQLIAFHDLSFSPKPKVPEVGTSLAAAVCCFLVLWLKQRRVLQLA